MEQPTLGAPDPEPRARPPLAFWDRSKFLVLFVAVWALLVWNFYLENRIVGATFGDALYTQGRAGRLWIVLFAIELARQVHYVISEHWSGWHNFWSNRIFGSFSRRTAKLNDWNRYRLGRVMRFLALLAILAYVLGQVYDQPPTQALFELPSTIWKILPMAFQILFAVIFVVIQFAALFFFLSRGGVETYMPNDIKTRFTDIWGQDNVLARVKENLVYLDAPERIEEKGGYVPAGILLWGPPGTGKTLIAEAVAGETGKPFVFVEPGAFTNMFMGVGILKVKSLFRKLRKLALRYGGVVVFFDEADALGSRGALAQGGWNGGGAKTPAWEGLTRCNGLSYLSEASTNFTLRGALAPGNEGVTRDRMMMGMGGGGSGTLQSLLTELSGMKKPRGFINRFVRRALGMRPKPPPKYRLLIMMATNMPESLDEAMLRPGRIDRIYKVGYPSKAGRIRTYEGYLAKVAHELTAEDIDKLATITPYATGATIKDMINEALITAIRDDREVIEWKDIIRAKQLKDLGLPEDVEYVDRERHATAIHEACHAVIAYRVRRHLTIDIATIEKGGNYLGMVASIPPEDLFTRWRSEYEADILVSLASLAGERMFFDGDNSSGVSGDLETATQIASLMEGYWGMGRTIASHGVTHRIGIGGGGGPGGGGGGGGGGTKKEKDLLASQLGHRIETKLAELYAHVERLLAEDRYAVLAVAHALETHKTLTGDDVTAIINGEQGPLIDGRVYRQSSFESVADEYHRRALDAHRTHERVGAAFPALVEGIFEPTDSDQDENPRRRRRAAAVPASDVARSAGTTEETGQD